MKHFKLFTVLLFSTLTIFSCNKKKDEDIPKNEKSNIPTSFLERDVITSGDIHLSSKNLYISIWDNSIEVDGDIVSIFINGEKIIDNYELLGSDNKKSVNATLKYDGYNYILLYAHNLGTIGQNTCTVKIDDGTSNSQTITLEANMTTNNAYNLIVD